MKKILRCFLAFIFIFSFSGCSCKDDEELLEARQIAVPSVRGYLSKDMNGNYVDLYPFNTGISLMYFEKDNIEEVASFFQNEYIRLHKLFDRHYYYFDDDGNIINNLRIINESSNEEIVINEDLVKIIKEGIRFTKLSKGKFNIGVGNLSSLWDNFIAFNKDALGTNLIIDLTQETIYSYQNGVYSEDVNGSYIKYGDIYIDTSDIKRCNYTNDECLEDINGNYIVLESVAPSLEQINQAKLCTPDYNQIENIIVLNEQNNTIRINNLDGCNTKLSITLGALAKSYVAEKISNNEMIKNGNYLINAGQSTIKIIGDNLSKESKTWVVGITDSYLVYTKQTIYPINSFSTYRITINEDISISSSSGDQNHYYHGDKYYHHIVDPITGYPNQNRLAVTSLSSNAMYADIITTSLMSMNMEESIIFINDLINEGIEMDLLIQQLSESGVEVYATSNMKNMVTIASDDKYADHLSTIAIKELNYDA